MMKDFERIDQLSAEMSRLEKAIRQEIKNLDIEVGNAPTQVHANMHTVVMNSLFRILLELIDAPKDMKEKAKPTPKEGGQK